jgi:hypothetical protein
MSLPSCDDCKFYLNNGVAHCVNPRVSRAVGLIMGDEDGHPPVGEMQIHFIRFTDAFCGIDARWFERKERDDRMS